jgi:mutator family transposase
MSRRKEPRIPDAVLDQLLAGADPKTAFDPNGLLDDLKKALAERVLNAEMDHHLAGEEAGNRRNGYGKKTVMTDTGRIELAVPRDRQASFDPQLIAKYQRRFPGFDVSDAPSPPFATSASRGAIQLFSLQWEMASSASCRILSIDLCLVPPSQINPPSSSTRMMEVLWPSRPISIQPSLTQSAILGYFSVKLSGSPFRLLALFLSVGGGAPIR